MNLATDPKIYLAIDNCFASKRWTRPAEWMRIARDLGLSYVEASADTECDPLYADPAYLKGWLRDVRKSSRKTGVRVCNLYSGHGTYSTLGLAGTDRRNRARILDQWLKVMANNAASLDAGLGFFCHAFCDAVLQDAGEHRRAEKRLYKDLSSVAAHAQRAGVRSIGVEQMYTPHQIPWTMEGSFKLLAAVYAQSAAPFYLTIDTGHQSGQRRFLRPARKHLELALRGFRSSGKTGTLWLGPLSAYTLFRQAAATKGNRERQCLDRLEAEMDRFPHLFASVADGDPYAWLAQLGCYSPIVHLQQTDGTSSSHLPFTEENSRAGIIQGDKVLKALAAAYAGEMRPGMPPRCSEIYLTLEPFSGTAAIPADILEKLAESVAYWRQYIPKDGVRLSKALSKRKR
jgi:sugar phosphate isomerase/epimerase